ncbi:MAG: flagellar biosynthetic protein FliR [Firmicutes bacterium]|nr:flagellar biosynthetic protein FliR [Bacillota bacterium]
MSAAATYFLLFIRFTALMVVLPFFNWRGTPVVVKIGFAALFAYLIYLAESPQVTLPQHLLPYLFAVLSEVLLGLLLGFLVLLLFTAIRMAGQLLDLQAGLAMTSLFDPMFSGQVTIFGQYYYLLALILFFSVNAHHYLFLALARSVELVPPGGMVFQAALVPSLIEFFAETSLIALQLAAPVITILIFCDLALGLLSKTVPQLHVFIVGMPLKVGVALLTVYLILPYLVPFIEQILMQIQTNITTLLQLI